MSCSKTSCVGAQEASRGLLCSEVEVLNDLQGSRAATGSARTPKQMGRKEPCTPERWVFVAGMMTLANF